MHRAAPAHNPPCSELRSFYGTMQPCLWHTGESPPRPHGVGSRRLQGLGRRHAWAAADAPVVAAAGGSLCRSTTLQMSDARSPSCSPCFAFARSMPAHARTCMRLSAEPAPAMPLAPRASRAELHRRPDQTPGFQLSMQEVMCNAHGIGARPCGGYEAGLQLHMHEGFSTRAGKGPHSA